MPTRSQVNIPCSAVKIIKHQLPWQRVVIGILDLKIKDKCTFLICIKRRRQNHKISVTKGVLWAHLLRWSDLGSFSVGEHKRIWKKCRGNLWVFSIYHPGNPSQKEDVLWAEKNTVRVIIDNVNFGSTYKTCFHIPLGKKQLNLVPQGSL